MSSPRIGVVGGGLAGIAAALAAADAGAEVVLVERRPTLGGLTTSIRRNGLSFDNGQHVFLRCCTAYRGLHRPHRSRQSRSTCSRDSTCRCSRLTASRASIRRAALPAPLHLARVARRATPPVGARARCGSAARPWRCAGSTPTTPRSTASPSVTGSTRHGQAERAIERLWNLIALPTLNVPAARGLARPCDKGLPRRPSRPIRRRRHRLVEGPARRAPRCQRRPGARARRASRRCSARRSSRSSVRPARSASPSATGTRSLVADAVIVATPPRVAAALGAFDAADGAERLGTSPIVNVHLVLDRAGDRPAAGGLRRLADPVRLRPHRVERGRARASAWPSRSRPPTATSVAVRPSSCDTFFEALRELFPAPATARGRRRRRHPRAGGDVPCSSGSRGAPPSDQDRDPRAVPRRRLVRHGVAGDDGRRGAQRPARPPRRRSALFSGIRGRGPPPAGRGRDVTVVSSPATSDGAALGRGVAGAGEGPGEPRPSTRPCSA